MKLIMENWRAFLQEEESLDLDQLNDEEKQLLKTIISHAQKQEDFLTEEVPDPNRSMKYSDIKARRDKFQRKKRKEKKKKLNNKTKRKRMEIAAEYWKTHVEDVLSGAIRANYPITAAFKKAYELLDCRDQDSCALWNIPRVLEPPHAIALKDIMPLTWKTVERHYEQWRKDNESLWQGDVDGIKAVRTHTNARTTDVSELPGLRKLKDSDLYKSLSKKLCPDSLTGGMSLACLAQLSAQIADLFPGE